MDFTFQAGDLTAEQIPDAETEALQPLLERCEDFHQLSYGRPALVDQARRIPAERPPNLTPGQGHLFALKTAAGDVVGLLEALRDFPAPGEWYLGILLLAPEVRGQGRGEGVARAYEGHVRAQGGRLLRLAVLEQNEAAHRFWTRMGFQPEKWVGPLEQGLKQNRLLRMTKALG
ncbi:GNAT family N-acetyltransferase [Corallococcus praedator]|uniref:GNAT family N-acetyltransferase n=1 Tax=Corallococcus praedator TaxID=2316724 RepID=A0ABX9QG11_9BACT|nr:MULTISPECIES: GNAT family N-acetyltransferase [Corallococcus]RKH23929.1 GNAT family N-acetyltransferase [Corallococcus sp. CA031C]RKI02727.1 GNAT family N-acetyltransferase [Corallococcus praedator]